MKVKVELIIWSYDDRMQNIAVVSCVPSEIVLPSVDLDGVGIPLEEARQGLFLTYSNLSLRYVNIVLSDVKQGDDGLDIYYGVLIPRDTSLKQGHTIILDPLHDHELCDIMNRISTL